MASYDIKSAMPLIGFGELRDFAEEYAEKDDQFAKTIWKKLVAKKLAISPEECVKLVKKAFSKTKREGGYYHSYVVRDWDKVFECLDDLLIQARALLSLGADEAAAVIAIETLYNIAINFESELLEYDEEGCILPPYCEGAGDILRTVANDADAPRALKDRIIERLREIINIGSFNNYDVYDTDELLNDICIAVQTPEESLHLLDALIEDHKEKYDLHFYVQRKAEMLQDLGREEERESLIDQYLDLPEVRKLRMQALISSGYYEAALDLCDGGIRVAQFLRHDGTVTNWKEQKISIYRMAGDSESALEICRQLFAEGHNILRYYKMMKELTPEADWKPILAKSINELDKDAYSLPEIYCLEKDYDALLNLIERNRYSRLDMLLSYGQHFPTSYAEHLLSIFASELRLFAEKQVDRTHYRRLVSALKEVAKLKGGQELVDELVAEFRTKYYRRRAMIEELDAMQ